MTSAMKPKAIKFTDTRVLAATLLGAVLALGGIDSASADPPCWAPA